MHLDLKKDFRIVGQFVSGPVFGPRNENWAAFERSHQTA